MSRRTRSSLVAAVMVAALVPSTTFADSLGSQGTVDAVTVYESSSDDYSANNGILTIKEESGTRRDYKWGGTWCSGRNVGASSVALLVEAMRSGSELQVIPSYKFGNGGTRCLTGFKIKAVERVTTQ